MTGREKMFLTCFMAFNWQTNNKYDNFHIHMDYVILYGFTEGK